MSTIRQYTTHFGVIVSLLAAGLTTACGEDFVSRTSLSEYSILGIETSSPEVSPSETLQVTAHDYSPDNAGVTYRWSLCPYSLGANLAYECAEGVPEIELSRDASFLLDLSPEGIDLKEVLDTTGTRPGVDGLPRSLETGFDIWLRLISGSDCDGCLTIESVKRLVIRQGEGPPANNNPTIERFEVLGEAKAGTTVRLQVATDAPEDYATPSTEAAKTEEYLYTWYTTQGKTEPSLTFGDTQETELKLPDEAGPLEIMVAVRDGRGGMALARQTLQVE